jgi:hypothetical protein
MIESAWNNLVTTSVVRWERRSIEEEKKKTIRKWQPCYQVHVGGVSHRTTSRYNDVANIQSRPLHHQSVITAENRNSLDNYSQLLCFRPVWHTAVAL